VNLADSPTVQARQSLAPVHLRLSSTAPVEGDMKKWQCVVCGFIYDEAVGMPWDGIPAGTKWDDIPADWVCPDCGVGKEDFEMIEV
jgi:rubredoxin